MARSARVDVDFQQGDIFEADFRDADVVTLFLLPHLNERLSSTIAFLKARNAPEPGDPRYGSEALREKTIAQAIEGSAKA